MGDKATKIMAINWHDPVMDGNPYDTSYASYMSPLVACLAASDGPVLELGMGHWSSPFLHRYCLAAGRYLRSVDEDPAWIEPFKQYNLVSYHEVGFGIYDFVFEFYARQQWGVVFMDHSPGERRPADAVMFKSTAKFIIVHDYSGTDGDKPSMAALFEPVRKQWKNAVVAEYSPSTLILSNSEIPWFPKARRLT